IRGIQDGPDDGSPGAETGQNLARSPVIAECQSGSAIGSENVGQRGQIAASGIAERKAVVREQHSARQQQRHYSRHHGDQVKLQAGRQVAQERHRFHGLITVARLRSLELIWSSFWRAASRFTSKCTAPFSSLKLTTPPCAANPGVSPTVNTLE